MSSSRKRARPAAPAVFVMEEHSTALEVIHRCIRRKALPFSGTALVHVDSHPDLSWPRELPAAIVTEPRALYEALDTSVGGIAEWILPLVAAGHVDHVNWVRSPFATQISDGTHRFLVGPEPRSGMLRVSSDEAYFDDEALHSRELSLESGAVEFVLEVGCDAALPPAEAPWILDVCLDWLKCANPFREGLRSALGPADAAAVLAAHSEATHRRAVLAPAARRAARARHEAAVDDAIERAARGERADRRALLRFYAPRDGATIVDRLLDVLRRRRDALDAIKWAWPCLNLPASPAQDDGAARLARLERTLTRWTSASPPREPALVTVARSADDGYTPGAAALEGDVLAMIRRVYGEFELRDAEQELHSPRE